MIRKINQIKGGVWFAIVFFGFIVCNAINQEYQLAYCVRYTISEPQNIYGSFITRMRYEFYVNGERYEKTKYHEKEKMGQRYFVKFSYKNPNYNRLIENIEVPDSLEAPPQGWEELPYLEPKPMTVEEFNKMMEEEMKKKKDSLK